MTAPDVAWLAPRLEQAVGRMTVAVAAAPADASVATCPGWDVRRLVDHLVRVHRWAAAIVLTGEQQRTPPSVLPTADELAGWYARSGAALLAALRAVQPDQEGWTLVGTQQRAAFWWRRQLHEVTVHTVDALVAADGQGGLAGGVAAGIDAAVAADGVDEVLTMWPRRLRQRGRRVVLPAPVEVVATDTGDRWLLAPGGPVPAVSRPTAPGPADQVTGTAADLYLRLWGRGGEEVEIAGAAAAGWLAGPLVP